MTGAEASARRPGRGTLAVAVGFVATAILSLGTDVVLHAVGVFPVWGMRLTDGLLVLATTYRVAFTVLGGYLTARLAPAAPMKHVWTLALIGTAMASLGAAATWNKPELGPHWYPIALVVTALPSVWLGARVRGVSP